MTRLDLSAEELAQIEAREKKTVTIKATVYGPAEVNFHHFDHTQLAELESWWEEVVKNQNPERVIWIQVQGIKLKVIEKLGVLLGVHDFLLQDIMDREQPPKLEVFENYLFTVVKNPVLPGKNTRIQAEHTCLILGHGLVLSIKEGDDGLFKDIHHDLKMERHRIRHSGADYLTIEILDALTDQYSLILEDLQKQIEGLEESILNQPSEDLIEEIYNQKQQVIGLRGMLWPLLWVNRSLEKVTSRLIHEDSRPYLADLHENTNQALHTANTFHDMLSGLLNLYLSSVSNKMNETMKVLTIISAIFIPLTYITSLYGMNFRYMPELQWKHGYFMVMLFMVVVVLLMLRYFKRKDWL